MWTLKVTLEGSITANQYKLVLDDHLPVKAFCPDGFVQLMMHSALLSDSVTRKVIHTSCDTESHQISIQLNTWRFRTSTKTSNQGTSVFYSSFQRSTDKRRINVKEHLSCCFMFYALFSSFNVRPVIKFIVNKQEKNLRRSIFCTPGSNVAVHP